ncbi:hypothetical protein [Desulfosporosinus sp. I2]|uniref:hypothetical protein n=1 Tax=Desulfosporosinus sp. I2 TaxID=1617025 RepID=UPI000B100260|nr:hypothetical protein [Desulfosporosinus sp. I2]
MLVFPAFITPTVSIIGMILPFIVLPVIVIVLVVWHVRKLNSIDGTLREILEILKNN